MKSKKVKKSKTKTTVWPFKKDGLETWAFWDSIFSPEECKKIIEIGNKKILIKAKTFSNNKELRKSKISWLYPSDDLEWAYKRITDVILDLNNRFFKFELYGFIEGFQFTYYKHPDGKYKKHIDKHFNGFTRKLSLSIQLSDPKSYDGGDLLLHTDSTPIIIPKEQGKLIAFPSYVLHEVTTVTRGERYSLVAWITGPQFK
jgi:PKHD-type hydroxylase